MRLVRRKPCKDCRRVLTLRNFYRHPSYRDGRMSSCKECHNAYVRANRELKRDHYREVTRRYDATPKRRAQRAAYMLSERGREVRRAADRRYRRFKALEARA